MADNNGNSVSVVAIIAILILVVVGGYLLSANGYLGKNATIQPTTNTTTVVPAVEKVVPAMPSNGKSTPSGS